VTPPHAHDETQVEIDMLNEHLPYELDMLEGAFVFLHHDKHAEDRKNVIVKNAMIEAFWTHARNLLEFLTRAPIGGPTGVAAACDFTGQERPTLMHAKVKPLLDEVNDQITHLRYERKTSPQEKLAGHRMPSVKAMIDSHIQRFEQNLQSKYKPFWSPRAPSAMVVEAAGTLRNDTQTASFRCSSS